MYRISFSKFDLERIILIWILVRGNIVNTDPHLKVHKIYTIRMNTIGNFYDLLDSYRQMAFESRYKMKWMDLF